MLKNLEWVRDLVDSERRMEETGIIDLSAIPDENRDILARTHEFLRSVKELFIEYSSAFNNMKNSTVGGVKIYGISNTVADFMLFRNGYKLLFSTAEPGRINISFQAQPTHLIPGASISTAAPSSDDYIDAKFGPFGELTWTYRGTPIEAENLVRYYLTRFVRESAK